MLALKLRRTLTLEPRLALTKTRNDDTDGRAEANPKDTAKTSARAMLKQHPSMRVGTNAQAHTKRKRTIQSGGGEASAEVDATQGVEASVVARAESTAEVEMKSGAEARCNAERNANVAGPTKEVHGQKKS